MMYYAPKNEKEFDELVKLAEKSNYDLSSRVTNGYSYFKREFNVLYPDEGTLTARHNSDILTITLSTFKRRLSRPILKFKEYILTKLKGGVKIGCTTFKNKEIKEVVHRIKNKISFNFNEDGELDFEGIVDVSDIKLLVKEYKEIIHRMENPLDNCIVTNDSVNVEGEEIEHEEVLKLVKSLGYKF